MIYTNFFWEVSWVASINTSSSIPELNFSIKIFGQLPVFSVQLTCSSWASYFHFSSSLSGLSSCLLVLLLGFSSKILLSSPNTSLLLHLLLFYGLESLFQAYFICFSSDCFALLLIVVFSFFLLFGLPVVTGHGLTFTEVTNFFLIHLFMDLCLFSKVYCLIFLFIDLFVLVPPELS